MEPKHLKHIIIKSEQERERMKQEQDALWEALDIFDIVKENFPEALHKRLANVEKDAIVEALAQTQGNQKQAADKLGMGRTLLIHKIKKYQLDIDKFKR
jgi:DNA-binding NtrC family response regulator